MTSEISNDGVTNVPVGPFTLPEQDKINTIVVENVLSQLPMLFVKTGLTPIVFRKVFQYPWKEEWDTHLLNLDEAQEISKANWSLSKDGVLVNSKPFQLALSLSKDEGLAKLYPSYKYLYDRVVKMNPHYGRSGSQALIRPNGVGTPRPPQTGDWRGVVATRAEGHNDIEARVVQYLVDQGYDADAARELLGAFCEVRLLNELNQELNPNEVELTVNVETDSEGCVYVMIPISHYESVDATITLSQLLHRIERSRERGGNTEYRAGYVFEGVTEMFEDNAVDNRVLDYDWETVTDNVYNAESTDSCFDGCDCTVRWDSDTDADLLRRHLSAFMGILPDPEAAPVRLAGQFHGEENDSEGDGSGW